LTFYTEDSAHFVFNSSLLKRKPIVVPNWPKQS